MIKNTIIGKPSISSQASQDYIRTCKEDNAWALYMLDEVLPGSGFWTPKDSSGNGRDMNPAAIAGFSQDTALIAGVARSMKADGTTFAVGGGGPQSGDGNWAIDGWIKLSSIQAGNHFFAGFGEAVANHTALYGIQSGKPEVGTNPCGYLGASLLSTGVVYYLYADWDGTTCRMFVNCLLVASGACSAMAIPAGGGSHELWLAPTGVGGQNSAATLQAIGFYDHLLAIERLQAHYGVGLGARAGQGVIL